MAVSDYIGEQGRIMLDSGDMLEAGPPLNV